MKNMTHDEIRMCRRERIQRCLQYQLIVDSLGTNHDLHYIKALVRWSEQVTFGQELKAYA